VRDGHTHLIPRAQKPAPPQAAEAAHHPPAVGSASPRGEVAAAEAHVHALDDLPAAALLGRVHFERCEVRLGGELDLLLRELLVQAADALLLDKEYPREKKTFNE
jgi:hypothetical protein